jgi:hypothetical protein
LTAAESTPPTAPCPSNAAATLAGPLSDVEYRGHRVGHGDPPVKSRVLEPASATSR